MTGREGVRRPRVLGLVGLCALGLVAVLGVLVRSNTGPLQPWDQSWHDLFHRIGTEYPAWLSIMAVVTAIGATATVTVVDVILFAVTMWQRRYRVAVLVALVGIGGWAVRVGIVNTVKRARPPDAFWEASGYAFPSGHTTNAALMLILIGVVAWPWLRSAARYATVVVLAILALAVAVSRVAGGVHWPTDVIGGLLLAVGYACLVGAFFLPSIGPHRSPTADRHGERR